MGANATKYVMMLNAQDPSTSPGHASDHVFNIARGNTKRLYHRRPTNMCLDITNSAGVDMKPLLHDIELFFDIVHVRIPPCFISLTFVQQRSNINGAGASLKPHQ